MSYAKWISIRRLIICIVICTIGLFSLSLITQRQIIHQDIKKLPEMFPIHNEQHQQNPEQINDLPALEDIKQIANQNEILSYVNLPYKLVHLDLKGSPPKLSYLKKILKSIKSSGGNGILLEYEDMFPYHNKLANISNKKCWTEEQVKDFLLTAKEMQLEVIPLVQTFGHLEFALKLDGFVKYREVHNFPQEICPSFNEAITLVFDMVNQVLDFHKKVLGTSLQYVHIGCDEVFHLGECERCRGKDTKELFLNHVIKVAKHVRKKYKLNSIIWDDMIRKFYTDELIKAQIGSWVELMVWDYTEDVDHLVSPYLWPMYTSSFTHIWAASAYKGAFGESLYQVHIHRHALNQVSWLSVLSREVPRIRNLRGIALTGWSRYDHFSVLCELLPVSIPSMILSLQILKTQDLRSSMKKLSQKLKCGMETSELSTLNLQDCRWEGHDLYLQLNELKFHEDNVKELLTTWDDSHKGWLTRYNVKYNESSTWRLEQAKSSALMYLEGLNSFERGLKETLNIYFDYFVADEYLIQRIGWVKEQLQTLINNVNQLSKINTWKRRPLNFV